MSDKTTAELRRQMNRDNILENIAWWTGQRDDHQAKGKTIGVRRCQEEIDLWQQELEDLK